MKHKVKKLASLVSLMIALSASATTPYLVYVAVDPCRIVDTRENGGVIPAGDFREFQAAGSLGELAVQGGTECLSQGVPQAVSAYVVVVPKGRTGGVATAYPADNLPPPAGTGSTVNFNRGLVTGNTTNITLSDGKFSVLARSTGFHLVVDVQGYFYPMPKPYDPCPASSPVRYVDNGDGTICDNRTGLMWEKKLAADGSDGGNCTAANQDERDVHCVNNYYIIEQMWEHDDPVPLTVNTVFIATLNQEISNYYTKKWNNTCFADHCDWRVPKLSELQSIYLDGNHTIPCIDPIFYPVIATPYKVQHSGEDSYLSSTTTYSNGYHYKVDFGSDSCRDFGHDMGCNGGDPCGGRVRAVRDTR